MLVFSGRSAGSQVPTAKSIPQPNAITGQMLYSLFKQHVIQNPTKLAVVWRGSEFTYGALDSAVAHHAAQLRAGGINAGDTIALMLPNSAHFIVGVLAAWANGNAVLPLNTGYKAEEIHLYMQNVGAKAALVSDGTACSLISSVANQFKIDLDVSVFSASAPHPPPAMVSAQEDAIIMFSSGSTGTPKQVVRTHGQLTAEIEAARATIGLTSSDVIMCSVPLYHAHGFGNCFLAALMNGGTLLIQHGEFNPRAVVKLIREYGATIYPSVPFMCKTLAATPFPAGSDLSTLRLVYTAGAPLDPQIYGDFRTRFGLPLAQLYGSTETGAAAINMAPADSNFRSVGKPLAGVTIRIVDHHGAGVADGQEGEIVIDSPAMTRSYRGLPQLSAETFRFDGYHTGDLAHLDTEKNITITGRRTLMINVAGYKVDPSDVEQVIRQIPGTLEVVVLGQSDPSYGEAVKAVIVASHALTKDQVTAHCVQNLTEYKIPKIIEFVPEIPKSPLGKVLRKYL